MKTPELETERLLLRRFKEDDAEEIFECWESDPDVARYMMWESHQEIEKTREFISYELSMIEDENWYRWCIVEKETKKIIGTCLIFFNDEDGFHDVSYNLGKKYWGKGYITEAMKKVLDFAKDTLGVSEIVTSHAVENPASGRVLTKLGFVFEKEVEYICNGGNIHTTGKQYRWKASNAVLRQ